MVFNLFSHYLSPELSKWLSDLVFSPFTQLTENSSLIMIVSLPFGSLLLLTELRTKSSIQFSEPFQPNQTACFFSFQCLCSWFDLLLQSPPIKVLSVFCWHVFMVPVKQMQFLLHSPKKIFATCPYCKSIPVFTFNSVHSIVFIKNHYIKQISQ